MFYFGKRLGILVNGTAPTKHRTASVGRERLTFSLESEDGYERVEQTDGLVPKAVGKRGNELAYIVAAGVGRVTSLEEEHAERAKSIVIEEISKSEKEVGMELFNAAREIAERSLIVCMSKERASFISYLVAHDSVGYGPISVLLEDKKRIEEIEINAPTASINIFHVDYGRCRTNLRFRSEDDFRHNLNKFIYETDKELGEDSPIIDAQVKEARVHAQLKPYALSGAIASIRLSDNKLVGPDYLIKKQTTDFDVLAYLWLAMDAKLNILIAGSPASGKTTLMSALFAFVPRVERVLTIEEDVNELKVKVDINNGVALYGSRYNNGTNTREQVINALRMRPERLVVGEVRGPETRELFSGANLGVQFMTTMHSNAGGLDIVKKLMTKPMEVETRTLSSLDIALYMRHVDLSKRVLSDVYEYKWLSRAESEGLGVVIEESESVDISGIVSNGKLAGELLKNSKVVEAFSKKSGLSTRLVLRELARRSEFLKIVCESSKNANEVLERIQTYGW